MTKGSNFNERSSQAAQECSQDQEESKHTVQKKPKKRNKKAKKAKKAEDDDLDEFLNARVAENKWWMNPTYLNDFNRRGNIPACTKCSPTVEFESEESHRKHMQMIHGGGIYFKDVDLKIKVKSV